MTLDPQFVLISFNTSGISPTMIAKFLLSLYATTSFVVILPLEQIYTSEFSLFMPNQELGTVKGSRTAELDIKAL
jgi:hypothetical protein